MDDQSGIAFPEGMTTPNTRSAPAPHPLRTGILLSATITTGLTAGVFTHWSDTIMPGLGDVDDRTFVAAFQALDAAIINPLFLGLEFTGSVLLIGLSLVLHLRAGPRAARVWLAVALASYLVAMAVTFGVHEPLNQELRNTIGLNDDTGYAAARALLDESAWTAWNTVRAVATTLAFGCLAWTLVIHRGQARRAV